VTVEESREAVLISSRTDRVQRPTTRPR